MELRDIQDKLNQLHGATGRDDLTGPISAFILEQQELLAIRKLANERLEASLSRLQDQIQLLDDQLTELEAEICKPSLWQRIKNWFNEEDLGNEG